MFWWICNNFNRNFPLLSLMLGLRWSRHRRRVIVFRVYTFPLSYPRNHVNRTICTQNSVCSQQTDVYRFDVVHTTASNQVLIYYKLHHYRQWSGSYIGCERETAVASASSHWLTHLRINSSPGKMALCSVTLNNILWTKLPSLTLYYWYGMVDQSQIYAHQGLKAMYLLRYICGIYETV